SEVYSSVFNNPSEPVRKQRSGERNSVCSIAVRNLRYRSCRRMQTMFIPAVHWIGAGGEWFPLSSAIRRITGILAVHDVRGNRQDRLSVNSFPIRRIFPQLSHKRADDPRRELIDSIVVIAELRERALSLIIGHKTTLIADHSNFCVTNCRKAIGN